MLIHWYCQLEEGGGASRWLKRYLIDCLLPSAAIKDCWKRGQLSGFSLVLFTERVNNRSNWLVSANPDSPCFILQRIPVHRTPEPDSINRGSAETQIKVRVFMLWFQTVFPENRVHSGNQTLPLRKPAPVTTQIKGNRSINIALELSQFTEPGTGGKVS